MKTILLAGVLALASGVVAAAPERVDAILADQQRGYPSPLAAMRRLQAAIDVPGPGAPPDLRRRYHAALAMYAQQTQAPELSKTSLEALAALARDGQCRACEADRRVIEAEAAIARRAPDEAVRHIDRAAALADAGDPMLRHRLHFVRARLHDVRGEFGKGIAEALAALALAEQAGSVAGQVRVMTLMVGMNADLGDHARAATLAREAYALAKHHDFTWMMGYVRLQQGYLHALAGNPVEQAAALHDALKIAGDDPGLAEVRAISLANLADYHLQRDELDAALDYARRAEAASREIGDDNSRSVALANEGVALSKLGRHTAGIERLERAIALAKQLSLSSYVVAMTEELVKAYERAGRYREAVSAMHRIAALNEDITRQERDKAVLELQEKYAAERRSREIEQLSTANRLREAELAARTWQQRLWAAVAIGLALAAVPLVRRLVRMRHANRKLSGDIAVLAEQSIHDPLTGAFNRRHCQSLMGHHEAHLVGVDGRQAHPGVGLMLLDVDFFKKVNDTWGHAAGDRVLVEIARRLHALVRQQDAVVRWGGEEFVLVLPGTPAQGVEVLAERVLAAVADEPVDLGDCRIAVTVSIGTTTFPLAPGLHWEDSLHVADLALYLSKSGGRNRATCVTRVEAGADTGRLRSDLAAAQAAGDVGLNTIVGPAPRPQVLEATAA